MQLEILLISIALLPTIAAWRAWTSKVRLSMNGTRNFLFVVGLVGASLSLALYVAFASYVNQIGGFGVNFAAMLRWARPGVWISLAALLLVLAGRGRSRLFGLASTLIMLILWIMPIWGM